ncbi:hypothetical protein HanXRQr2_Chr08g0321331 [Helianthus annuus]|uniref:Uncharacterized protein n=1 Tax=Helianthus annuus TaxID=4232 RepID=A0A9K3IBU5_HELAN|nr:hypothetical protein HanXRQr2_Chr08g0321331 [Helianthus annuus]
MVNWELMSCLMRRFLVLLTLFLWRFYLFIRFCFCVICNISYAISEIRYHVKLNTRF